MIYYQRYVIGNLDGNLRAARFGIGSDAKSCGVKNHPKTEFGRHGN